MPNFFKSIKTRYFISFTIVIMIPILILNFLTYNVSLDRLISYKVENQKQILKSLNELVFNKHFIDMENIISILASNPDLVDIIHNQDLQNKIVSDWDSIRSIYPERAWIYYGDHDNNIIVSPHWDATKDYDLRLRPWYINAINNKGVVWSEPFVEYVTNKDVLTASLEIFDDTGESRGVLAIDTFLDQFIILFLNGSESYNEILILSDKSNNIIATNSAIITDGKLLNLQQKYNQTIAIRSGKEYIYHEDVIPVIGWKLASLTSVENLKKDIQKLKRSQIISILISLISVLMVSYFLSQYIITRISKLNRHLQKIESGNLNATITFKGADEFIQIAENLNNMTSELSNSLSSIRGLSKLLSHSVNNSLARLDQRIIRLLEHPALDKGCKEELDIMGTDLHQLLLYIQNNALANIDELDETYILKEEIDIAELLESIRKSLERSLKRKNLQLIIFNPLGSRLFVCSRQLLLHCLENLIDNAIKFSPVGNTIEISVAGNMDSIEIEVLDYGAGIKNSEVGYLFNDKVKISSVPTGGETSHGIGLSISAKVLKCIGCSIEYIQKDEVGAIFKITIPENN